MKAKIAAPTNPLSLRHSQRTWHPARGNGRVFGCVADRMSSLLRKSPRVCVDTRKRERGRHVLSSWAVGEPRRVGLCVGVAGRARFAVSLVENTVGIQFVKQKAASIKIGQAHRSLTRVSRSRTRPPRSTPPPPDTAPPRSLRWACCIARTCHCVPATHRCSGGGRRART